MESRVLSLVYLEAADERLDRFLAASLPEYSRARLQALIKKELVFVNGAIAKKAGQMIGAGTRVELRVPASAPSGVLAESTPLDIIFENDDVLVVNKPAGMVVHPAAGHATGTLVNAVLGHDPHMEGIGGEERPGVVHRLDKDTSGLVILAKNDATLRWLQAQFSQRLVKKTYLALVDGKPPSPAGRIEAAIGRDPVRRKRMAVLPEGKGRAAISEYKTVESFADHTLLAFHPITGRTHQIRVHCAFLGCPVVGDTVYGQRKSSIPMDRLFLHAQKITLALPGERQSRGFEAPVPDALNQILADLRGQTPPQPSHGQNRKSTWIP